MGGARDGRMGRQTPGTAAMKWDRGFYYFQEPETRKYILKQNPTKLSIVVFLYFQTYQLDITCLKFNFQTYIVTLRKYFHVGKI